MISLRRITSSGRFVPEIDGLRFLAIASVVLYHFYGFVAAQGAESRGSDLLRVLLQHGYRGVNLFYMISGFVLGLPFAAHSLRGKEQVSLRAYFLRRLTRLEPPYVLNMALLGVIFGLSQSTIEVIPHLLASLLYSHNIVFGAQSPLNGVAWTLEVEVQFYCLAPLLATLFKIRPTILRRTCFLFGMLAPGLWQTWAWDADPRLRLSIAFAIQFFLAGFLLADLYLCDWDEHPRPHWGWDAIALGCWPLVFLLEDRVVWVILPLLLLAGGVAAFQGVLFRKLFRQGAVTAIGGMCYTIYLYHYVMIPPVLRAAKDIGAGAGFAWYFAVQLAFYLPLLALVSVALYLAVERPCMRKDWPQRLAARISS